MCSKGRCRKPMHCAVVLDRSTSVCDTSVKCNQKCNKNSEVYNRAYSKAIATPSNPCIVGVKAGRLMQHFEKCIEVCFCSGLFSVQGLKNLTDRLAIIKL